MDSEAPVIFYVKNTQIIHNLFGHLYFLYKYKSMSFFAVGSWYSWV